MIPKASLYDSQCLVSNVTSRLGFFGLSEPRQEGFKGDQRALVVVFTVSDIARVCPP